MEVVKVENGTEHDLVAVDGVEALGRGNRTGSLDLWDHFEFASFQVGEYLFVWQLGIIEIWWDK